VEARHTHACDLSRAGPPTDRAVKALAVSLPKTARGARRRPGSRACGCALRRIAADRDLAKLRWRIDISFARLVVRQGGQPVFRRLGLVLRPFVSEPEFPLEILVVALVTKAADGAASTIMQRSASQPTAS
jgi:hypothetical protein